MPGNVVRINNSNKSKWYVGDSKMEELIKFLNDIGFKEEGIYSKEYEEKEECSICHGQGSTTDHHDPCTECGGSGRVG